MGSNVGIIDLLSSKAASEERNLLGVSSEDQAKSLMIMAQSAIQSTPDYVVHSVRNTFNNPKLAAAVLGNIEHETGGSFDYKKKQYGGGPGRGLFQMEYKPMISAYNNFLKDHNIDDSADGQIKFINDILSSDKYYDIGAGNRKKMIEVINNGDVKKITEEFSRRVLRPGKPQEEKRIKAADKWYKNIGGKK